MIMNIICQCCDGWSVYQIIKSNFIIVTTWVLGTLVIDWVIMKNNNLKDKSRKNKKQ